MLMKAAPSPKRVGEFIYLTLLSYWFDILCLLIVGVEGYFCAW